MLSLIIPTYNEAQNISPLVQRVVSTLKKVVDSFEIIVVDDDSPDHTWQIAQELAKAEPRLKVIRRLEDRGLATAVVAGWKASKGEILGVMDGDLQHEPETLEKLVRAISTTPADIVIASRHVKEGGVSDWNLLRRTISWGATCLATFAIPGILRDVVDPMSGYFLIRRSVVERAQLKPTGYKILLEVLARGTYSNVVEVPYIFEERKVGSSKLGPRQYAEYLLHLARLAWETGELDSFLRFCMVGMTGIIVNQAALWLLTAVGGLYYVYASIGSVEFAIVSNFLLNEFWTFRAEAQRLKGISTRLSRFLKFNLICAVGGILNTTTLWFFTESFGIDYLLSNLLGVSIGTVWNYWVNANITWGIHVPRQEGSMENVASQEYGLAERKVIEEQKRPV